MPYAFFHPFPPRDWGRAPIAEKAIPNKDNYMAKAVFCIANSETQAERMVAGLKRHGFRESDISVLFPDKTGTTDFAHEHHTKAPEGAVAGASALGVVGGCVGWLAGAGALMIPGIGPFIAAGPLIAALSGIAVGAGVGGIAGALVGMGIPEFVARRYAGKIQAGNILLSVHADNATQARKAKKIFSDAGCTDASVTSEAEVPAPSTCARA